MAGTIGLAILAPENLGECNSNQAIAKIRLKPNSLNPNYLVAFLNSRLGRYQSERIANGQTVLNINLGEIGKLLIPVPPRSLQDQIAQVMQEAYRDRQTNLEKISEEFQESENIVSTYLQINRSTVQIEKRFIKNISDLRERMDVHHHMPHFVSIMESLHHGRYKLRTIQDIALKICNGATPRAKGEAYIQDSAQGIPFIRVTDISNYSVSCEKILYIKKNIHEKDLKKSQVVSGDVLLSMAGTIGLSAVIPDDILEANINQAIASIQGNCILIKPLNARVIAFTLV